MARKILGSRRNATSKQRVPYTGAIPKSGTPGKVRRLQSGRIVTQRKIRVGSQQGIRAVSGKGFAPTKTRVSTKANIGIQSRRLKRTIARNTLGLRTGIRQRVTAFGKTKVGRALRTRRGRIGAATLIAGGATYAAYRAGRDQR